MSSVNCSRDDHTDNNAFRYPEVIEANTPERIKTMEESSHIDDFNTDMRCTSVVMQPDSCGSTDRIYTEHEDVVKMPVEGQLDSLACHGVKTKDISLHMNVEQAARGYNFAFDKSLDLAHTANFDTQDGRLENIVYGALNNNVQRKCSATKTSVGVPDTIVVLSSPTAANVSHDGQLSGTMNVDICRSVNDQESREAYVVQQELAQACVNMGKTGCAISDSSSNPEEIQEISAGSSISTPTCLGTDGQTRASDFSLTKDQFQIILQKSCCPRERLCRQLLRRSFATLWLVSICVESKGLRERLILKIVMQVVKHYHRQQTSKADLF
ncbi:hypothetical protein D1007_22291 [Hordeum vulgare]|nr:hypothetical protein D1007_22291 [Hordeum vulgare]